MLALYRAQAGRPGTHPFTGGRPRARRGFRNRARSRGLRASRRRILEQHPALDPPEDTDRRGSCGLQPTDRGVLRRPRTQAGQELRAALADALAGRRPPRSCSSASPGIGKSRLADELTAMQERDVERKYSSGAAGRQEEPRRTGPGSRRSVPTSGTPTARRCGRSWSRGHQSSPRSSRSCASSPHIPRTTFARIGGRTLSAFRFSGDLPEERGKRRPARADFDDLQAADEPSLLLLHFIAGEMRDSRLLIVGTYRDIDPTVRDPLASTLAELAREPVTRRISLAGLAQQEVARYVELSAGVVAPGELIARIHTETDGNPLFVGEVVRLLDSEGRLLGDGAWNVGIPEGIREVIGRRLRRLSEECRHILLLAAVLGREFDLAAACALERDTARRSSRSARRGHGRTRSSAQCPVYQVGCDSRTRSSARRSTTALLQLGAYNYTHEQVGHSKRSMPAISSHTSPSSHFTSPRPHRPVTSTRRPTTPDAPASMPRLCSRMKRRHASMDWR